MTYEEFVRVPQGDLERKASDCFSKAVTADDQQKSALLLEAQFYMGEIERRDQARISRRDVLLEVFIIVLIVVEILIALYNLRFSVIEAANQTSLTERQAGILDQLQKSATATADTLKNTLTVTQQYGDPCSTSNKVSKNISQMGNGVLLHNAGKIWVCYMMLVGTDDENVSLVMGSGNVCSENTVALIGGTSAAIGASLSARGGFSAGSGNGAIAIGQKAFDVCLLQSGTGRLAGTVSYAVTPS
jgi:hypothetical protein